jgi:4-amino-4-deoxy-L-arabinose transferase-like glycosyltransferase
MTEQLRKYRWTIELLLLLMVLCFAAAHFFNLGADFPNGTQWHDDYAKYTDEGWYGNAAIRWHLTGHWYVPGDFNPAPAVPVWPLLEWLLFFVTGVKMEAARGLAVCFFFLNLFLSYKLMRRASSRWAALLGLTLLVTSPFLFSFSRLAILEPMLTALLLTTLLFALRLREVRHPRRWAVGIGLLLTMMLLTKTTTIFLMPAIAWAVVQPLWPDWRRAVKLLFISGATFVASFAAWMGFIASRHLLADYKYFFFINKYDKPPQFYWPLISFWWSFHGALWFDVVLVPLSGVILLIAFAAWFANKRNQHTGVWAKLWLGNPLTGISFLVLAGYIGFMTIQNHPQARYFAMTAYFFCILVAQGVEALLSAKGRVRALGWVGMGVALAAVCLNGSMTARFALNPTYTYRDAAVALTKYIDEHPNGNRLLVSISADEISLFTHLPGICDDFGTMQLVPKMERYQPGWYAAWNEIDPGEMEDLHVHYSLEQVAQFPALDDPDRNLLVLFKLHPVAGGKPREVVGTNLQQPLADDKIEIPVE